MTILSSNNAQCPSVTRVFHPIGQGGFYTEDVNGKLVVYDCGGNSTAFIKDYLKSFLQKGQTIAAVFISHLHWDHINGLEKLFSECNVEKLYLPQLTKNRIIETILYNSIHFPESNANGKSIVNFVEQIINGSIPAIQVTEEGDIDNNEEYQDRYIHSGSHIKVSKNATGGVDFKWVYIPYNPLSIKPNFVSNDMYVQKIKTICIKSSSHVELAKSMAELLKDLNHIELQKLYTTLYKKPHNSQSMTVFSGFLNTNYKILTRTNVASMSYVCSSCYCSRENHNDSSIRIIPCNFLYTGDFEAKERTEELIKFYKRQEHNVWDTICGIQIPHHGSRKNYNQKLYHGILFGIVSVGTHNRYHHPNIDTLIDIFKQGCMPNVVTEDLNTQLYQQFYFLSL